MKPEPWPAAPLKSRLEHGLLWGSGLQHVILLESGMSARV